MNIPFKMSGYVGFHEGSHRKSLETVELSGGTESSMQAGGTNWQFWMETGADTEDMWPVKFRAMLQNGAAREVALGLMFEDPDWNEANYVLIPGAVYAGNRFRCEPFNYPPAERGPRPGEDRRDLRIIDLPRLRKEAGPSHLDQLSIDSATPAIGIYFPKRKKGLLILSPQTTRLGCFNYEVIESDDRKSAQILIGTPGIRHDKYFSIKYREPGGYVTPSTDRTADFSEGDSIEFSLQFHWFDCDSVQGLFDRLFAYREACFENPPLRKEIPYSAVWEIIQEKQNRTNWREDMSLYQTSLLGKREPPVPALLFQTGWCGGMIGTYPLLQEGHEESVGRVLRNLDFFFTGLSPSGFFYPYFDGKKWTWDPGHKDSEQVEPTTLTRRVGDVLYFLLRQLMLLRERNLAGSIKEEWEAHLERNIQAILKLWKTYGDLGQFIDLESGKLTVAGTTSGALVPAALVLASEYFDEPRYLAAALEIADFYRLNDLADGLTTGGPGDAMQAPDSESVFALLESFILLHDNTGESRWLTAARDAAVQGASWAMSYDYKFPEGTALHTIDAQSRGAFLANVQNKTAVPGICALSGQGLLRLYRKTGDKRFMHFLREICHTIPQYMGRRDKRIPCAFSGGNPYDHQPEGWICERVNITQWGEPIGELFAYSTWCEVAMMLVWADIPGVYADAESGLIVDIDHVEASWIQLETKRLHLRISNPTNFDAKVRLLIETDEQRNHPLPINAASNWPLVAIPAGGTVQIKIANGQIQEDIRV